MLHSGLRKLITVVLLVLVFQGFDLNNRWSVDAETIAEDPFIEATANYILKVNEKVDKYLKELLKYNKLKQDTSVKKNLKNDPSLIQNLLSPPQSPISIRENPEAYSNDIYNKCIANFSKIKIQNYEFTYNLSSTCLNSYLNRELLNLSQLFETQSFVNLTEPKKQFLLSELEKVNSMLIEFYNQIFAARLLHASYFDLNSEIVKLNSSLYDILNEIKQYSIKLPNASTTSCN